MRVLSAIPACAANNSGTAESATSAYGFLPLGAIYSFAQSFSAYPPGLQQGQPGVMFDTIEFMIQIGSVAPLATSSVTAALVGAGNATLQTITLKTPNQAGWDTNTTHVIEAALTTPQPLSAFSAIMLSSTPGGGPFGIGTWNVQGLSAGLVAHVTGQYVGLANVSGNPFAQLSIAVPTVTIPVPTGY